MDCILNAFREEEIKEKKNVQKNDKNPLNLGNLLGRQGLKAAPYPLTKSRSHFFRELIENEIQWTDNDLRILIHFIEYATHFFECPIKGSEFVNKKKNLANSYIFP